MFQKQKLIFFTGAIVEADNKVGEADECWINPLTDKEVGEKLPTKLVADKVPVVGVYEKVDRKLGVINPKLEVDVENRIGNGVEVVELATCWIVVDCDDNPLKFVAVIVVELMLGQVNLLLEGWKVKNVL